MEQALAVGKLAGEEIARPQPLPEELAVDLIEALRRSVADIQRRKGGRQQEWAESARDQARASPSPIWGRLGCSGWSAC